MATGLLVLLALWWWVASSQPAYVLPGPGSTWQALRSLATGGRLWSPLWVTVLRTGSGLLIAAMVSIAWGALCASSRLVDALSRSWLALLMAVPPIVIVVIGMLAFGPTAAVVVLVVALVTIPLLTTTTRDAIGQVDPELLEMARAFGKPPRWRWRHVVAPTVLPPVLSAVTVAAGQSLRVSVMAELLATATGLGAQLQRARSNLETADVFAFALVLACLTLLFELLILTPLRRRLSDAERQPQLKGIAT